MPLGLYGGVCVGQNGTISGAYGSLSKTLRGERADSTTSTPHSKLLGVASKVGLSTATVKSEGFDIFTNFSVNNCLSKSNSLVLRSC